MTAIRAGLGLVGGVLTLDLGPLPVAASPGDADHGVSGDPGSMMERGGDQGSMLVNAMHGGGGHDPMVEWMGAWMVFWLIVGVLVVALIITTMVWLVRSMRGGSLGRGGALDELDSAYARGEVTREEYLQRRADLGDRR